MVKPQCPALRCDRSPEHQSLPLEASSIRVLKHNDAYMDEISDDDATHVRVYSAIVSSLKVHMPNRI